MEKLGKPAGLVIAVKTGMKPKAKDEESMGDESTLLDAAEEITGDKSKAKLLVNLIKACQASSYNEED